MARFGWQMARQAARSRRQARAHAA
jgi:hypothetical protein